ncbi:MAG: triose-phosphate isomerase [Candidatus Pacebacteria bacterium]|nr:triose-phosphate isomerase [Candidatus Paceibacterota bacterium]MCD8508029.1 triose-phosphate isomerase [Candidatus Paceibacterota bacterium]MCD8528333.1 triose-phosphate isomerase [Candidatus Paceibacterota bacterium]MCD8563809.1 triose-phosphate isomerase [Candidatus Paceibacterota bacterium]
MKKYIIANWKMNVNARKEAVKLGLATARLAQKYKKRTTIIACPSTVHISLLAKNTDYAPLFIGAQDITFHESGAHTGETSPLALKDFGIKFSLIGHSERRAVGETSAVCALKVRAAIAAGIQPILCIGELARDKKGGHYRFVEKQLRESLSGIPVLALRALMIAYEPVWAISSTQNAAEATPEDIREMALFIQKVLSDMYGTPKLPVRILYGGSVNTQNAAEYSNIEGISGLLVGSASLNPKSFEGIVAVV